MGIGADIGRGVSEGSHSYYGVPLQVKDQVKGTEIFHRTSFELIAIR